MNSKQPPFTLSFLISLKRTLSNGKTGLLQEALKSGYEVLLPEQGILACASGHGGAFDLEGRGLAGPARSNPSSYPAQLTANRVHVAYPFR